MADKRSLAGDRRWITLAMILRCSRDGFNGAVTSRSDDETVGIPWSNRDALPARFEGMLHIEGSGVAIP